MIGYTDKEDVDKLRSQKLVEARLTSLYLSVSAAQSIDESTIEYIKQYGKAKKKDIRELLWDKLPDALSDAQKEHKVSNLLAMLRKTNIIATDSAN